MKILLYIEPRVDMGKPYLRGPWVHPFSKDIINTLRRSAITEGWEYCITLNEPLGRKYGNIEGVKKVYFTQEELFPPIMGDWLDISVAWYYETYTEAQMSYFERLIKDKFHGFTPDIVITFSPAPYLRRAFPEALILNHEVSFFSRAPYPMTWYLDPLGMSFSHSSFLNKYRDNIRRFKLSPTQKEMLNNFKRKCRDLLRAKSPYDEIIKPLRERFDHLVLLPLTRLDTYSFYGKYKDKFKNQYQYMESMMNKIPVNAGVIIVPHPDYFDLVDGETIAYLREKYPNLIFHEDFQKYYAPSQYILSYVDLFIGEASSLCFQTLMWGNKLINIGSMELIADAMSMDEVKYVLERERTDKDNILFWMFTRYAASSRHLHNPEWLSNFLVSSLDKFRKTGVTFDFFDPIDGEENIFKALSDGLDENVPQINPNMSYDRLKKAYEDAMSKCQTLKAEYDALCSKDMFSRLQDVIKGGEEMFQQGKVDEATQLFSQVLSGTNRIKATVMNNLAVVYAHKGELQKAERLLDYLIKHGYESGDAVRNLEAIRNLNNS